MARKRMKSKIQPSVQSMLFRTPTVPAAVTDSEGDVTPGTGIHYIDLSQCASLMNRRFYRQGINWAVSSFKILSAGFEGVCIINKLPNTWVMSNAWEKSFRAWQQMIKNATEEFGSESVKGKFLDFKIYANAGHHSVGYDANLLPIDSGLNTAARGQWDPSSIEVPETTTATGASTEYELIAVGPNNPGAGASGLDAKSLIAGYSNSRSLPSITDPNVPDDSASYSENWMLAMFNDGTLQDSSVLDTLELEGNQPPYPYENSQIPGAAPGTVYTDTMYPGGDNNLPALQVHDYEIITTTTVGGSTNLKGGNFPCGLIEVFLQNSTNLARSVIIQVDLVPGHHRGYLCEPMTEM